MTCTEVRVKKLCKCLKAWGLRWFCLHAALVSRLRNSSRCHALTVKSSLRCCQRFASWWWSTLDGNLRVSGVSVATHRNVETRRHQACTSTDKDTHRHAQTHTDTQHTHFLSLSLSPIRSPNMRRRNTRRLLTEPRQTIPSAFVNAVKSTGPSLQSKSNMAPANTSHSLSFDSRALNCRWSRCRF